MRRILLVVLLFVGCSRDVSGPDGSCRRYPLRFRITGNQATGTYTCTFPAFETSLACRSDANLTFYWRYPSLEDFVTEGSVPNRFRRTSVDLKFASDRDRFGIDYHYDDQRRLARRVRTSWTGIALVLPIDTTSFLTWDAHGRPLSGRIVRTDGSSEPITIAYDDVRREVSWSNGERHRMDDQGNTLFEILVFGTPNYTRQYEILATAETCLP